MHENDVFQKTKKANVFQTLKLDKIYLVFVLIACVATLIVELILQNVRLFYLVTASLLFVYFFVRHVVLNKNYFPQKIVGLATFLTIIALSTMPILPSYSMVSLYILPSIYILAILAIFVYVIARLGKAQIHFINLFLVSLLPIVPFIVNFAVGYRTETLTSIIAMSLGLTAIFYLLFQKYFYIEMKKIFHL